jgi:hypothetical protein
VIRQEEDHPSAYVRVTELFYKAGGKEAAQGFNARAIVFNKKLQGHPSSIRL